MYDIHTEIERAEREDVLKLTHDNGLPESHWHSKEELVVEVSPTLSTVFSATQADVQSWKISITPDAGEIRVKLCNDSPPQREFM